MNQPEPMTLSQAAAEVIQHKLDERGWDRSEAARRAGRDRVKVWRMLTGVTKKIDLDTFDALARALGVKPSTLMREITAHRLHAQLDPETQALAEHIRPKRDPGEGRRASGH